MLAVFISVVADAQDFAPRPASLMFDGVTVVDVEQGTLLPDQRVVIAGNRITVVGRAGAVTAPEGAQVTSLMEALERSLAGAKKAEPKAAPKKRAAAKKASKKK